MASQAVGSPVNMRPTNYFGVPLAKLLSDKIRTASSDFNRKPFLPKIKAVCSKLSLTQRVELKADQFESNFPRNFTKATEVLHIILFVQKFVANHPTDYLKVKSASRL